MPKAILVVQTNPVSPAAEDQFNAWYTERHIHDVVGVPGFASATRYVLSETRVRDDVEPPRQRYLAIYEVEADDLADASTALQKGVEDGSIPIDEALSQDDVSVAFYLPLKDGSARAEA
jgi:hypothetical protein